MRKDDLPQLKNLVATGNLNTELNLRDVVLRGRNVEYRATRFPAAIIKIREPKSTALVFRTGKMIVCGAKTEAECKLAAISYAKMLKKLNS